MSTKDNPKQELVERIRRAFLVQPVPPYPPQMGLDPLGSVDEYAGFAGVEWPRVDPHNYSHMGFDISAAIGFKGHSSPHMWNYYLPGFMTASLLHEPEHEISDNFMWTLQDGKPGASNHDPALPWWGGDCSFGNYTREQDDCVLSYLEYMREFGFAEPHWYMWEKPDDRMMKRWVARCER